MHTYNGYRIVRQRAGDQFIDGVEGANPNSRLYRTKLWFVYDLQFEQETGEDGYWGCFDRLRDAKAAIDRNGPPI